ncbi:hypothetical protein GCM10009827_022720 [Dactylosporangium maewongense]|uniref:Secreted protein n=1 Tax=Dactylosporangium maewongense TaxID=634393 RepID=A0ABN1ZZE9_9ACTN
MAALTTGGTTRDTGRLGASSQLTPLATALLSAAFLTTDGTTRDSGPTRRTLTTHTALPRRQFLDTRTADPARRTRTARTADSTTRDTGPTGRTFTAHTALPRRQFLDTRTAGPARRTRTARTADSTTRDTGQAGRTFTAHTAHHRAPAAAVLTAVLNARAGPRGRLVRLDPLGRVALLVTALRRWCSSVSAAAAGAVGDAIRRAVRAAGVSARDTPAGPSWSC